MGEFVRVCDVLVGRETAETMTLVRRVDSLPKTEARGADGRPPSRLRRFGGTDFASYSSLPPDESPRWIVSAAVGRHGTT